MPAILNMFCPDKTQDIEMTAKLHPDPNVLLMADKPPEDQEYMASPKTPLEMVPLTANGTTVSYRRGEWIPRELTEEERKLTGFPFIGLDGETVMCSVTKEDQWGLNSIEAVVLGGQPVPYYFANGNVLVLTTENYVAFKTDWMSARFTFFPMPT